MPVRLEQVPRRPVLDYLASVHNDRPVTDLCHNSNVVRDDHNPQVTPRAQVHEQPQDPGLDGHVQGRCRFVRDEDVRFAGQRHGDQGAEGGSRVR